MVGYLCATARSVISALRPGVIDLKCASTKFNSEFIWTQTRSLHLLLPEHHRKNFRNSIINDDVDSFISTLSSIGLFYSDYGRDIPGAALSEKMFLRKVSNFEFSSPSIDEFSYEVAYNLSCWSKFPLHFCVISLERTCELYESALQSRHLPLIVYKARRDRIVKILSKSIKYIHGELCRSRLISCDVFTPTRAFDFQTIPQISEVEALERLVEAVKVHGGYVWQAAFMLTNRDKGYDEFAPIVSLSKSQILKMWNHLQEGNDDLDCKIQLLKKVPTYYLDAISINTILKEIVLHKQYDIMLELVGIIRDCPEQVKNSIGYLLLESKKLYSKLERYLNKRGLECCPRRCLRYTRAFDSRIEVLNCLIQILSKDLHAEDLPSIPNLISECEVINRINLTNNLIHQFALNVGHTQDIEFVNRVKESLLNNIISSLLILNSSDYATIIARKFSVNLRFFNPKLLEQIIKKLECKNSSCEKSNGYSSLVDTLRSAVLQSSISPVTSGGTISDFVNGKRESTRNKTPMNFNSTSQIPLVPAFSDYVDECSGITVRRMRILSIEDAFNARALFDSRRYCTEFSFEVVDYVQNNRVTPLAILMLQGYDYCTKYALFINLEHENSQIVFHTLSALLSNKMIVKVYSNSETATRVMLEALKRTPYNHYYALRVVEVYKNSFIKLEQPTIRPLPSNISMDRNGDTRNARGDAPKIIPRTNPKFFSVEEAELHLMRIAAMHLGVYSQNRGLLIPPFNSTPTRPVLMPIEKIEAFRITPPIIRAHKHISQLQYHLSTPNNNPLSAFLSNRRLREASVG